MKPRPRWIILWAGTLLLVGTPSLGQQRSLSCEEARDRALTRVTIVSNSRVLMEEDLATMSVRLRYTRQALARRDRDLKTVRKQLQDLQAASSETKAAEPEPEAGEAETKGPDPETEGAKPETPTDVKVEGKEPTQ